jgi:hypothetical protein
MTEVKKIAISKKDVVMDYNVDINNMSVAQMAEKYGVEFKEMKKILKFYGLTVRKNEAEPTAKPKDYSIVLVDLGNKTLEQVEAENKTKEAVTA